MGGCHGNISVHIYDVIHNYDVTFRQTRPSKSFNYVKRRTPSKWVWLLPVLYLPIAVDPVVEILAGIDLSVGKSVPSNSRQTVTGVGPSKILYVCWVNVKETTAVHAWRKK